MSASGGTRAIVAALFANIGIAITKFVAFLLTGSSSMLAESIHSVADSGNQVLLLVGGRAGRAGRPPPQHPFGYGRERYIYAFIVSIVLFSVGGLFALYEGYHKLQHPEPIDAWQWVPIVVLLVAIGLESFSFRTAIRESNHVRGDLGWVQFVRRAKAPELPVVLLEDLGALVGLVLALFGVGLTLITDNGMWDGIGTICIGVLLVLIAFVLALETKSLLLGEGATPEALAPDRGGAGGRRLGAAHHPHEDDAPRPGRAARRRQDRRRAHRQRGRGRPRDRRRRGADPRGRADRADDLPRARHRAGPPRRAEHSADMTCGPIAARMAAARHRRH